MKLFGLIIIAVSLSVAIGYRAEEFAPFQQKPNKLWSTGGVKSFSAGTYGKDIYNKILKDKAAAQRIGSNFLAARFVNLFGATTRGEGLTLGTNQDRLYPAMGAWYGVWFMITLIILWQYGVFAWLIVFAGVISSSILMSAPASWCWDTLTWDGPALAFAALAIVTRSPWRLLGCLFVGMLFKETIIVFSILLLFWPEWSLKKRVSWFVVAGIGCLIIKSMVYLWLYGTPLFFVGGKSFLSENLTWLCSFHLNGIYFAGGGLLLAWCLSKQKMEHVLIFIIFNIGILMVSALQELRHYNELLPMIAITTLCPCAGWPGSGRAA
jgi:hypothetical protein